MNKKLNPQTGDLADSTHLQSDVLTLITAETLPSCLPFIRLLVDWNALTFIGNARKISESVRV